MARLSASTLRLGGLILALLGATVHAESIRTSFANLRAGPASDSRVITALPRHETVTVLSTWGAYAEVRVERTGLTGWVYYPAQGWSPAGPGQASPAPAPAQAPIPAAEAPAAAPVPAPVVAETPAPEPPPAPAEPAIMDALQALPRATGPWAYPLPGGRAEAIPVDELRLEMEPLDATVLFRKQPYDRSAFPVRLVDAEGTRGGKVAVKGSFSRNFLKKSLLITLDKGQEAGGRRRFALNAMATDPTQTREWLAWDLIHKLGLVAPKARYTRLYINGEFIGLYLDIEWMDAAMFERLGLGASGELYEPDSNAYCGDLGVASVDRGQTCWSKLSPGDKDLTSLDAMVRDMAATPVEAFDAWLDRHFDAQSVIDWLVVNTLTQNGDTYNKNYFLHKAGGDGRWRVIPWDYDLAWGRVADVALPFPRSIYNGFHQYAFPPDLGAENLLKRRVFDNPRLYARYLERLRQVLTPAPGDAQPAAGWYEPLDFRRRLADLAALTRATRPLEKYPVPGADNADALLESLAFFNEWRGHLLRATLLERTVFGNPRWVPLPPQPPLPPELQGQRRHQPMDLSASADLGVRHARIPLVDPLLGWPLGVATLREADAPVRLTLENAREGAPRRLPPGVQPGRCIERTWFATVKSDAPATLDLEFDYLHESSTRREVPDGLDESALRLYWFDGRAWRSPDGHANGIANLVALRDLRLEPDVTHRFVACQGPRLEAAPP